MATKNITPRNNDEGQIGSSSKKWASAFISDGTFDTLSVAGQAVSGGGVTALTGLSDVIISSAQNNQVLKYNGENWVNAVAPATLSDTDDLSEGSSNLYFTNVRSRSSISVTDSGGDGSLSYNSTSGVLTYTGPSAAETRAHFSAGTGVTLSNGAISIAQAVGASSDVTFNDLTVTGDLTVSGTTTTIDTETINLSDNTILLNSNYTGSSPSENCGIEVERGTQVNKTLVWNETTDKWTIGSETFIAGTFEGNLTGNVTGTVSSIANHNTDSLSEGSSNLYFTNERVDDRVNDLLTSPSNSNLSLTYDDSGNTLSISAADITYSTKDILILGGATNKSSADNHDNGVCFRWYDSSSSSAKNGFFGYDISQDAFVFYDQVQSSNNEVVNPNVGNDGGIGKFLTSRVDIRFRGNSNPTDDQIRLYERLTNGSSYIGIKSPQSLSSSYTLTLPGDDGDADQVLKTNGSGVLSWADQTTAGSGLYSSSGVISTSPQVITVTVVSSGGNKYALDGVTQKVDTLVKGVKYRFDQSDNTNGGHPLAFSTASNGGGSSYTAGVTTVGSPGSSGAYTEIIVPHSAPSTLYYYCTNHSGMGASVKTEIYNTDQISEGSSNLYFTNERVDDRVDTLITAGAGISKTYNDSSNTLTLTSDATLQEVISSNATSTVGATIGKVGVGLTSTGSAGIGYVSTQGSSNHNLSLDPQGSGVVVITGNSTRGAGKIKLNCENNSHGVTIQSPPHSAGATYTLTLPINDGNSDQVLKTNGSGVLSWVDQSGGGGGSSTTLQSTVTSTSTLSGATSGTHVWILNGSTITVTLPNSGITNGTIYHLKNINSTKATISAVIDGVTSKEINQYDNLTLVATGTGSQWYIL